MPSHLLHFDLGQGCAPVALCTALMDLGASYAHSLTHLPPVPQALLQKATQTLQKVGYEPKAPDLEIMSHFYSLINALNPKAISASRVSLSLDPADHSSQSLLELTQSIPVYERLWPAPSCDLISLALLKACASHFGARGESQLVKIGIGDKPKVLALLCETSIISSQANTQSFLPLFEIKAIVQDATLLPELKHRLTQSGGKSILTSQVLSQDNVPKTQIHLVGNEADRATLCELLLILGQALEVQIQSIEQHTLHKKTISISLGSPQKPAICRATEYIWNEHSVRIDPFLEDLEALSKARNLPQEIVRADVLTAWKKRDLNNPPNS